MLSAVEGVAAAPQEKAQEGVAVKARWRFALMSGASAFAFLLLLKGIAVLFGPLGVAIFFITAVFTAMGFIIGLKEEGEI